MNVERLVGTGLGLFVLVFGGGYSKSDVDTCPDILGENETVGTTCVCGISYAITHDCCKGEQVTGPGAAQICVVDNGNGTYTIIPRSQVGPGPGQDPGPEAPAVENEEPVIVVDFMRAVTVQNGVETLGVGIPAGSEYSIRWGYRNQMMTALRPSGQYAMYQVIGQSGPSLETVRGFGTTGAELIDVRPAPWSEVQPGSVEPKSEEFPANTPEQYQAQLVPMPSSAVNTNVASYTIR